MSSEAGNYFCLGDKNETFIRCDKLNINLYVQASNAAASEILLFPKTELRARFPLRANHFQVLVAGFNGDTKEEESSLV